MISSDHGAVGEREEKAYLIVISGGRVGTMIKVKNGMRIGRSNKADFRAVDDGISRLHCQIEATTDGALAVRDLESANGTFVNDKKVTVVRLNDGDKIRIGSTTILKFSYADELDESFQRQMYNAALRDPLTQLYNRRYFMEQLTSEFAYCYRHELPLSLIMIDLDHFKEVNDTYGHLAGDAVLTGLAQLLMNSTRKEDLYARYGGEEFSLLCRGTAGPVALSVANRIRRTMETARLAEQIPDLKVTLSAGVAALPEQAIGTPEELIAAADEALYQAKALGRNRVCLFDPDLEASDAAPGHESALAPDEETGEKRLPAADD